MSETNRVLDVGTEVQLLIDDHLVHDIWLIRRSPEMPSKYLNNPVFPGVSSASVVYDDEADQFKMWYGTPIPGTHESTGAYAVSDDGLHWEKPDLGIVEAEGSTQNNFIRTNGFGTVMWDPHDPDPSRRYKMMTKRRAGMNTGGRAFAAFSPDGITWTDYPTEKSILRASSDGNGMVMWDDAIGKYVNFRRPTTRAAMKPVFPEEIGFPDNDAYKDAGGEKNDNPPGAGFATEDDFVMREEAEDYIHRYLRPAPYVDTRSLRIHKEGSEGLGCNRRIARAESDDFIHWTEPEVIIRPDELDPPRLYSMGVTKYHGMYLGVLMLLNSWGSRRNPGCPQESETMDVQLTFSRDGWRWERLANRPVLIPRGLIGTFDAGMISHCSPAMIEYKDELRIYYGGMSTCHNVSASREGGIGVARLPKERIVARVAGDETGALLTKPVTFSGDSLYLNAKAHRGAKEPRGLIRVELTDTIGTPIEGFTVTDCAEIREDGFRIPVRWNGSRSLSELAGKPVRLRFYMHQARLYAFRFGSAD